MDCTEIFTVNEDQLQSEPETIDTKVDGYTIHALSRWVMAFCQVKNRSSGTTRTVGGRLSYWLTDIRSSSLSSCNSIQPSTGSESTGSRSCQMLNRTRNFVARVEFP
jgi:hypothetical protein